MNCEQAGHVQAFHDGELPPQQRAALEAHLRGCAQCAELLSELRRMSQLIAAAPMSDLPPQAMDRLERSFWRARDRGVLRVAEWMTGIAAAILVGAAIFWNGGTAEQTPPRSLQAAALMPPPQFEEEDSSPSSDVVVLAEWMANDLSQPRGNP